MPKYVLLEFPDNNDADAFVKETQDLRQVIIDHREYPDSPTTDLPCNVVGVFRAPGKFCECPEMNKPYPDHEGHSYDYRQLRRGANYGWMVHIKCRLAVRIHQSPRNLLDPDASSAWAHQRTATLKLVPLTNFPITLPRSKK